MTRGARIALLALAAVILVVAFIALRPAAKDDETTADTPTTTPTAAQDTATPAPGQTSTPTPSPRPTVDPGPILTGASVRKLRFDKGDTVRFRVKAPRDEEVHIHGYDIKRDVKAGQIARISFKATIDGIFEVEFEDSATQIAELRVDP
jgi:hypothetical protein